MPLEKIHISNSFFFFFLGEKNPITTNVFSYWDHNMKRPTVFTYPEKRPWSRSEYTVYYPSLLTGNTYL